MKLIQGVPGERRGKRGWRLIIMASFEISIILNHVCISNCVEFVMLVHIVTRSPSNAKFFKYFLNHNKNSNFPAINLPESHLNKYFIYMRTKSNYVAQNL